MEKAIGEQRHVYYRTGVSAASILFGFLPTSCALEASPLRHLAGGQIVPQVVSFRLVRDACIGLADMCDAQRRNRYRCR